MTEALGQGVEQASAGHRPGRQQLQGEGHRIGQDGRAVPLSHPLQLGRLAPVQQSFAGAEAQVG
jgi:hypothetical protein